MAPNRSQAALAPAAVLVCLAMSFGAHCAYAAQAPASSSTPGISSLASRVIAEDSLLGLLLVGMGTLIGYWAKALLERLNARAAAHLAFAKDVTGRITTLANEHYWPLANYAGVVASEFETHLELCTYHLLLHWEPHNGLEQKLSDLAKERAAAAFPAFCQLIGLFYAFQFGGGNTYLLTTHSAGETCKRLYNMFVGSLPERLNLANLVGTQIRVNEEGIQKSRKLYELRGASFSDEIIKELPREREAFEQWLQHNLCDVTIAAAALRALNELLSHELALLYKDWFRRGRFLSSTDPYVSAVAYGKWPGVLTEESVYTMGQAAFEGALLRPLGTAVTYKAAQATEKAEKAPPPPPPPAARPSSVDRLELAPSPPAASA
jgi:hypothetical protein